MKESIRVFAPATIANVVCGYDILGLAVDAPGDEVIMRRKAEPGVIITKITGDDGRLPIDASKNTVSASVQLYLQQIGRADVGVEIELHKQMPIGSGLGSSAASTVAGLYAINSLLDSPLSKMELVPFAMKGEELACGTGHADNVAPALLGGFVLIRSYQPLDIIKLPYPGNLHCAIVFPEVDVPTRDARKMIREKVNLKDAVVQWGNIAGLVSGLFMKDLDLIGRSMQDVIVEPVRSILIPDFYKMREIALAQGALSFGISGSGPSVFAFTKDADTSAKITQAIQQHLSKLKIGSYAYTSAVNADGPKILD